MTIADPLPESTPPSASSAADKARGRRLASFGWTALAAVAGYHAYTATLTDPATIILGVIMFCLAGWPAIQWARHGRTHLPAFEVLMLTSIPFYALPLFREHPTSARFAPEVVQQSALTVVAFLAAAVITYEVTLARPGRHRIWTDNLVPEHYLARIGWGLAATTAYLVINQYTQLIPYNISSILRAVFYGVGMLSAFVLMRRWGAQQLTPGMKGFVAINLTAQIILHISQLYLISGASLFLLSIIAFISTSRRVPVLALVIGTLVLGTLHVGKASMREIYWTDGAPQIGFTDLPAYFGQWIEYSIATKDRQDASVTGSLLERTSLFHVLCIVVGAVPDRQDFLGGETYAGIPAQVVPRLLWPNKPGPHVSNRRLAIYFGFVPDEDAAQKVSVAFGTPAEAYANFGLLGVVFLGGCYGFGYKKIIGLTGHCSAFSVGGLALVLLLAWSLQAEMTLSVWMSSLYQSAVVLIGGPLVLKFVTGRR